MMNAPIERSLSKLRDILLRLCGDLNYNVVISDRFCEEILKKQAACIVRNGRLFTIMTIRHPVSLSSLFRPLTSSEPMALLITLEVSAFVADLRAPRAPSSRRIHR